MDTQRFFVLSIFVILIGSLIFTNKRPVFLFSSALVALVVTQTISFREVLENSINTGVITLLLILVASAAIEKTQLLKKLGRSLIDRHYCFSFIRVYLVSGLSSAFMNNTAVVATLISVVKANPHHPASRLLIPLSYAAILGGTITLIGTSTNLILNSLLLNEGEAPFEFFDFSLFGLSVFFSCGLLLFLLSPLLPSRVTEVNEKPPYFIETEVELDSPLCGKTIEENGLRHLGSLFLVEIVRSGSLISPARPTEVIQPDDKLIFSGDIHDIHQLDQFKGLVTFANSNGFLAQNLKEVVITNHSMLIGKTLKSVGFRSLFDAAVVAIRRHGEELSGKLGELTLQAGDDLILAIGDEFIKKNNLYRNFFILSEINLVRNLTHFQEVAAVGGFLAAIAATVLQIAPIFENIFYYLALLTLTNTLSANELKQRIPFDLWVTIVGALSMATALVHSGLISVTAEWLKLYIDGQSPFVALVLVYAFTLILTELVTNNAAAALSFPIAYGVAQGLDLNITPFIMAVAFAASASFITPYGYQTNLMVFNTGRYHTLDFVKIGLPISLLYSSIVLFLIPVFLPFH